MFKTRGRHGLNAKQISVQSNDPTRPTVSLMVKAHLEVGLAVEPVSLNFGKIVRGRGTTQVVELIGKYAADTKILGVETRQGRNGRMKQIDLSTYFETRVGEGEQAGRIEFVVPPDAPAGRFHGGLVIKTDNPDTPELTLRVIGDVQRSVVLSPNRVLFRDTGQQNPQRRVLTVASSKGEELSVLEVSVDHPQLEASFSKTAPDRVRVNVTLNGPLEAVHQTATLKIRTSSSEDPLLEIPVELYRVNRPKPQADPPTSPTSD